MSYKMIPILFFPIIVLIIVGLFLFGYSDWPGSPPVMDRTYSNVSVPPPDGGPPDCRRNWKKCLDIADFMNNSHRATETRDACKKAADEKAGFATLEWSLFPFSSFVRETDTFSTGMLELLEEGVKFSNELGTAMQHKVLCSYDLDKGVAEITFDPK